MKATMEEYGFIIVYTIIGIIIVTMLFGFIFSDVEGESVSGLMPKEAEQHNDTGDYSNYNNGLPILDTATHIEVQMEGDDIDLLSDEFLQSATDASGNDLTDNVAVTRIVNKETGEILTEIPSGVSGTYEITYLLIDEQNQRVKSKTLLIVNVSAPDEDLP